MLKNSKNRKKSLSGRFFLSFALLLTFPLLATSTKSPGHKTAMQSYALVVSKARATLAADFMGKIKSVSVRDNENFQKGKVLIAYNCAVREAELEKAQAEVKSASAKLKSTHALKKLASSSELELINAQAEFDKANSEVRRIKALLAKCTIKAPFSGHVVETYVHAHEVVKAGEPLLEIVNNKDLELVLFLPAEMLAKVKVGKPFAVRITELNKVYHAKISRIGAHIDAASQMFKVIGSFTGDTSHLLPGMTGKIILDEGVKHVSR